MSEEEFLARWSRRKREARENVAPPEPEKPADAPTEPPPRAAEGHEPEVDLSSLPSIDSITSATDITAFLSKGIPQELSRAALRRAWTVDPTIRDFVGLAENAWDFNDPTAMPGFGPLDCSTEELAALIDRIVGGARKTAESLPDTFVESDSSAKSSEQLHKSERSTAADVANQCAPSQPAPVPVAAQPILAEHAEAEGDPVRRRTHGSALPR